MSSLSFVPRNLAKRSGNARKHESSSNKAGTPRHLTAETPAPAPPSVATQPTSTTQKATKYDDTDYANLIALSLSDYVLWLDPDLRQKLGSGAQQSFKEGSGYISLNYLFEHSTVLASLFDDMPGKESHATRSKVQSAVVKAIRTHAGHLLDIRLLLHSDQAVPRFGKEKEVGGGYEVRRKQVGLIMRGKLEWDACTLYLENIPPGYRSYAEVIRFVNALLRDAPPVPSSSTLSGDILTRVQGITFPPHHSDKPDTRPSCKGFALVTFAHSTDCEHLKNLWPWFREPPSAGEVSVEPKLDDEPAPDLASVVIRVARQYNFRVITKERWLALKAEYLTYRQRLVEEINASQDTRQKSLRGVAQPPKESPGPQATKLSTGSNSHTAAAVPPKHSSGHSVDPSSPYPPNCLVFVKNVHPETTKTTLRHLLSQAFRSKVSQPHQKNVEGLDYVDFNKGMTTCYIRLTTPKHAEVLVDFFSQSNRRIAQVSGMDESGTDVSSVTSTSPGELDPIIVGRVTGRPEEIYWEKVPVKVKRSAVERAISLMVAECEDGGDDGHPNVAVRGSVQKRSRDIGRVEGNDGDLRRKKQRKQKPSTEINI